MRYFLLHLTLRMSNEGRTYYATKYTIQFCISITQKTEREHLAAAETPCTFTKPSGHNIMANYRSTTSSRFCHLGAVSMSCQ